MFATKFRMGCTRVRHIPCLGHNASTYHTAILATFLAFPPPRLSLSYHLRILYLSQESVQHTYREKECVQLSLDSVAPQCPLCNTTVPTVPNDPNLAVERHILSGTCTGIPGGEARLKEEIKRKKERGEMCWRKGCNKVIVVPMNCEVSLCFTLLVRSLSASTISIPSCSLLGEHVADMPFSNALTSSVHHIVIPPLTPALHPVLLQLLAAARPCPPDPLASLPSPGYSLNRHPVLHHRLNPHSPPQLLPHRHQPTSRSPSRRQRMQLMLRLQLRPQR